jgi:hypothetical protein
MSNHGLVIGGTVSMPRHDTTHTHTDEKSHSLDIRCCLLGNRKTQWHETLSRGPRPLEHPRICKWGDSGLDGCPRLGGASESQNRT